MGHPKGRKEYEIANDREEGNRNPEDKLKEENHQKLIEKEKPGVDSEGRWFGAGIARYKGIKKYMVNM